MVAVSTAIPEANPEVAEARRRGLTVLSRAEALAAIAACRRCVAVSGTHGKTTTTSMLALILIEAGLRPSFLIGGDVNEIGTNAVWDTGEWLVLEADESDGTFLAPRPRDRRRHQRRARPPRLLRGLRPSRRRLRPLLGLGTPRGRGRCRRRRWPPRLGRGPRRRSGGDARPTPPTASRTSTTGRRRVVRVAGRRGRCSGAWRSR